MAPRLTLSVIIPVGPGDDTWRDLLDDLAVLEDGAEIILVASQGGAPAAFRPGRYGLRVPTRWLETPAGRARQQNAGAAAAGGETLWFLHADSRLPPASVAAATHFYGRAALGFFDLRFRDDGPRLVALNAFGVRLRSRWLGMPFGDQGLILPRRLFEELGGFDEGLPQGEDHALVWAARRAGIPLIPLRTPLLTSARRYAQHGWLRTTLRHARLTIAQARRFAADGHSARDDRT
ncbi:MAG: TIGR04283 family arsenosugar biosynthesis glycosyltransferase [Gammaproteobacteria bacterium]